MRVLVCGGRPYNDAKNVYRTLSDVDKSHGPITCVIAGCATGADTAGLLWARRNGREQAAYPAEWDLHGKSARPRRNQRILDEGKPDLVIGFPGGKGTSDLIKRAIKAGVKVIILPVVTVRSAPKQ